MAVPINLKYKKKLHYAELLISFGAFYQSEKNISLKKRQKKHKYFEYMLSLPFSALCDCYLKKLFPLQK